MLMMYKSVGLIIIPEMTCHRSQTAPLRLTGFFLILFSFFLAYLMRTDIRSSYMGSGPDFCCSAKVGSGWVAYLIIKSDTLSFPVRFSRDHIGRGRVSCYAAFTRCAWSCLYDRCTCRAQCECVVGVSLITRRVLTCVQSDIHLLTYLLGKRTNNLSGASIPLATQAQSPQPREVLRECHGGRPPSRPHTVPKRNFCWV